MSDQYRDYLRLTKITGTPSNTAEADVWWRDDHNRIVAGDGSGSTEPLIIGPVGNVPLIRPGAYHSLPSAGDAGSVAVLLNRAYALPFWPGRVCTMSSIAVEVTLLNVGNIRFGLYANDPANNVPGARIADYGTIASGIIGVRELAVSQVVTNRPHWLVIAVQGLLAVSLRARTTWEPLVSEPSATLTSMNSNFTAYYQDSISGALPATFTIAGSTLGPSAMVKLT